MGSVIKWPSASQLESSRDANVLKRQQQATEFLNTIIPEDASDAPIAISMVSIYPDGRVDTTVHGVELHHIPVMKLAFKHARAKAFSILNSVGFHGRN